MSIYSYPSAVTGNAGEAADSALDDALEAVGIGKKPTPTPYMRAAKVAKDNFFKVGWLQGWQWKVDLAGDVAVSAFQKIETFQAGFDIFVKDLDFGNGAIDVDPIQVGSGAYGLPTFSSAGEITMTVRDDMNASVSKLFKILLSKVRTEGGTVGIPKDYVFEFKVSLLQETADQINQIPYATFNAYVSKIGNVNFTRDGVNEIHTFPVILQKFSSVRSKTEASKEESESSSNSG